MEPLADLNHVSLTVSDLDTSARWYVDVLGLVEQFREDAPARKAAVLRFANGAYAVGLVQHVGSPRASFDATITGLDHLAFAVSSRQDLHDWAARLADAGVEHSDPIEIPPGEILNFRDPDGIALALFWDRSR
jgi:catechol 2,3-dioxygenase-like lactoylglutathione lyase family enzyme